MQVEFTTKWKIEICPNLENWNDKMEEYGVMAKLMSNILKRPVSESENTWEAF